MTSILSRVFSIIVCVTIITLTVASCSSGEDGTPQGDNALTQLQRRANGLAVTISAPPSADTYEIWSCLSEAGEPLIYSFHRDGTFEGSAANFLIGKEFRPSTTAPPEQLLYRWKATSESTLLLDAPDKDVQINWSNIEISTDGTMRAYTSNRGQLQVCIRNTVAKFE